MLAGRATVYRFPRHHRDRCTVYILNVVLILLLILLHIYIQYSVWYDD